jgi:tRNA pseudouridine38-40 synthase
MALSGRTDRGVHAKNQILAFSTDKPDLAIRALNGQLPPDIWVNAWTEVPDSFYPRYDVRDRTYRYYYSTKPSDIPRMSQAARLFLGKHDFRCFARIEPGKSPIKTIDRIEITVDDDGCRLEITAQSFLWHMVRCIAASLLQVSEGTMSYADIDRYLSANCTQTRSNRPPLMVYILWDVRADLDWHKISGAFCKDPKNCSRFRAPSTFLWTIYSLLLPAR